MSGIDDYMLPCLNKKLFGFECMGCGLQRSISLIFQGQFIDAFKMYPAVYAIIPLALIIFLNIFLKRKFLSKAINILAITSVAIIIVSFIVKKFY